MPLLYNSNDLSYQIGRNAIENTELIHRSSDMDIWFHIKDHPSAHLIYFNPEKLDLDYLRKKGIIYHLGLKLKKSTKYSKHANIDIIYDYIKNITPLPKPGLVKCKSPKTITI